MFDGKLLSLVVPCYNEAESVPLFYREACLVADELSRDVGLYMEIVFIDDGSIDQTLTVVRGLSRSDSRVRYVSFSRNFGKEAALYAGLQAAHGDWVATLDADLQDPPSLLPAMIEYIEGHPECDCVATKRETRTGEPPVRSAFARLFYRLINRLSDTLIVDGARDFRLMSRRFVDSVLMLGEANRFSKGLFSWVGFETHWISYENVERAAGKTKWNFWSLFKYSIEGIIDFSSVPLSLASFLGLASCLIALAGVVFVAVRALIFGDPVSGWPSLVCIVLFIGGLQLLCLGILGQYVAKIYNEVKHRPVYLIRETEEDLFRVAAVSDGPQSSE